MVTYCMHFIAVCLAGGGSTLLIAVRAVLQLFYLLRVDRSDRIHLEL